MRKSIEEYVRKCDSCQRRKEYRQFTEPLGSREVPERPFQITSMDITGPYPLTLRRNKYLLTFVDHFSKYAEYQISRWKSVNEYILEKLSLDTARVLSWLLTKAALSCPRFSARPARCWGSKGSTPPVITLKVMG